ncbi:MAG: FtsQ-type POTRA domain-containing protein [Candidatus Berkelbacteria bacterium]
MVIRRNKDYSRLKSKGFGQFRNPSLYNPAKKKKPDRLRFSFAFFKFILFILVLIAIAWYLFISSKFIVKDVIVEGTNLLSKDQIAAMIPKNQNILLLDTKDVSNKISIKFPEVADVQIFRGLPDAIKIVILEKEGSIVWQSGGFKYLVSTQGEVARQIVGEEGANLPIVIDKRNLPIVEGQRIVSANFIVFVKNIYANFATETNIKPAYFEIDETTFDVNLYTDAGIYIKLNSLRSSNKQLENLKKVLVEKRPDIHEYVDLRIDGWAYYK